ncbi:MAG: tetratricopeptide repeat protein [Crocinitomicaceae bacterium]|nr:tetratricopeptide repeat protein [Crocinitomicaceae bacterium]
MKNLTVIFLLLLSLKSFGNGELDSLVKVWNDPSVADTNRIKTMRLIVWNYYMYDNPDTAIVLSNKILDLAKKIDHQIFIGNGHSMIGVALSLKGDFFKSNEEFFQAKEIFEKEGYKLGLAAQYLNLGVNFKAFGDYPTSVDNFLKASKIYRELGNKEGETNSQNNVATVYMAQGDYQRALNLFESSLQTYKEMGDERGQAMVMTNIAMNYHHMGDFETAAEKYRESIRISLANEFKYEIAQAYVGYGEVLMDLGEMDLALDYMKGALELNMEIQSKEDVAIVYLNMSDLWIKRKVYKKAIEAGQNSLAIAKEIGAPYISAQVYFRLYQAFKGMNQIGDALEMHELYLKEKMYLDSIENKDEVQRIRIEDQYRKKAEMDSLRVLGEKRIQDEQLARAETEKQNQKIVTYSLLAVLGLALLFGGFAYNRFQYSKKQNKVIQEQKEEVAHAYLEVEQKNREIMDSIVYAKRIQSAILPPEHLVKSYLTNSFILYKPKDIVAGDFYWMEPYEKGSGKNGILFAAADCTGHGVPGAMVSVVCNNALNRAVREFGLRKPGEILDKTREIVIREFEHNSFQENFEQNIVVNHSDQVIKDGMDIALVSIEQEQESVVSKLKFSGAHNPLWIVRNGQAEMEEIKGEKQPIGKFAKPSPFPTHEVELFAGDTVYIFTDGFADQFGGEKGKKMKTSNFKQILLEIQHLNMIEQKSFLDNSFETWRGDLEQLDDVCVIGFRV